MRRLACLGTLAALGCASEGFPPGGPVDKAPPVIIESNPADRSVNATSDQSITLRFDEVIDDRQLRELQRLILVNPDEPAFEVILDDDTVILQPREPMLNGVTYSVTVLPGIRDRGGNATVTPRTILFSVGGETPITLSILRATITRDTTRVPLAHYRLDNDETDFGYTMIADSQGQVTLEGVAYGPYVATAWEERVRPEGWQESEEAGAQDSFTLGPENRSHEATYRIEVRDTTPPAIRRIEMPNSRLIRMTFDDSLPGDELAPDVTARLWEAVGGVSGLDVPVDSLPLEDVRGRRLAIAEVRRVGPNMIDVVPELPLERDRVYRVEIIGLANSAGAITSEGNGRTFRAEFEGPRLFRAEPLPWTGEP